MNGERIEVQEKLAIDAVQKENVLKGQSSEDLSESKSRTDRGSVSEEAVGALTRNCLLTMTYAV